MPIMNSIKPNAAMPVSAGVRRDVVWEIDPGASHGELSTRHWLWGHRAVPLAATSGHLLRNADELLELNLTVKVVVANDVVVAMEFVGAEFKRKDYGRLIAAGHLRVEGRRTDMELLFHDLGRSPPSDASARRFGTITGHIPSSGEVQRIWRGAVTGPLLDLYVHTEWIPAAS